MEFSVQNVKPKVTVTAEGSMAESASASAFPSNHVFTMTSQDLCKEYDYLIALQGARPAATVGNVGSSASGSASSRSSPELPPAHGALYRLHEVPTLPGCVQLTTRPSLSAVSTYLKSTAKCVSDALTARQAGPRMGLIGPTKAAPTSCYQMRAALLRYWLDNMTVFSPLPEVPPPKGATEQRKAKKKKASPTSGVTKGTTAKCGRAAKKSANPGTTPNLKQGSLPAFNYQDYLSMILGTGPSTAMTAEVEQATNNMIQDCVHHQESASSELIRCAVTLCHKEYYAVLAHLLYGCFHASVVEKNGSHNIQVWAEEIVLPLLHLVTQADWPSDCLMNVSESLLHLENRPEILKRVERSVEKERISYELSFRLTATYLPRDSAEDSSLDESDGEFPSEEATSLHQELAHLLQDSFPPEALQMLLHDDSRPRSSRRGGAAGEEAPSLVMQLMQRIRTDSSELGSSYTNSASPPPPPTTVYSLSFPHAKTQLVTAALEPTDGAAMCPSRVLIQPHNTRYAPRLYPMTEVEEEEIQYAGGPCDVVLIRSPGDTQTDTAVHATVKATADCVLDTEMYTETRYAYGAALLSAASGILQRIESLHATITPYASLLSADSSDLHEPSASSAASSVVLSLLQSHSDVRLQQLVPCRASHLWVVRPALQLAAHCLSPNLRGLQANAAWDSKCWQDALRSVSLSLDGIAPAPPNSNAMTSSVYEYVVAHTDPATFASFNTQDIVRACIQLFTFPEMSLQLVQQAWEQRTLLVKETSTFFHLLLSATPYLSADGDDESDEEDSLMTSSVHLLRHFLQLITHSTTSSSSSSTIKPSPFFTFFSGCSPRSIYQLETQYSKVVEGYFAHSAATISMRRMHPDDVILKPYRYGTSVLLTLSFLSEYLSSANVYNALERIASMLHPDVVPGSFNGLLPSVLQAHYDRDIKRKKVIPLLTLRGARLCRRHTYAGDTRTLACSESPLLSPNDPNYMLPTRVTVSSVTEWELFHLALCISPCATGNCKWMAAQRQSALVDFSKDGLRYGLEVSDGVQLPTLTASDSVSIGFSTDGHEWFLHWYLNDVRTATIVAPGRPMWLVMGYAPSDRSSPSSASDGDMTFRCHFDYGEPPVSPASSERSITGPMDVRCTSLLTPSIPSLHAVTSVFRCAIARYATLACKRLASHNRSFFMNASVHQFVTSDAIFQLTASLIQLLRSSISDNTNDAPVPLYNRTSAAYLCNLGIADYALVMLASLGKQPSSHLGVMLNVLLDAIEVGSEGLLMKEVHCVVLFAMHTAIHKHHGVKPPDFDAARLAKLCLSLERSCNNRHTYRPLFSQATAPSCALNASSTQACAENRTSSMAHLAFADEGILLSSSTGQVSFSARLYFPEEGKLMPYQVGVSITPPSSVNPPTSGRTESLLSLFSHVEMMMPSRHSTSSLMRYQRFWLSPEKKVIFGSGDTITVIVNCSQRTVGFLRNGEPLGTLFKIPDHTFKVYPHVGLCAGSAIAEWVSPPHELEIHARNTLRSAAQFWGDILLPEVRSLVYAGKEGSSLGLVLLGSDGDESRMTYRSSVLPSQDGRGSSWRSEVVRVCRLDDFYTTIERPESSGERTRVSTVELSPCYSSTNPCQLKGLLLHEVLETTLQLISAEEKDDSCVRVTLNHPAVLLRLLRVWSSMSPAVVLEDSIASEMVSRLLPLIFLIVRYGSGDSDLPVDQLLQTTWESLAIRGSDDLPASVSVPLRNETSAPAEVESSEAAGDIDAASCPPFQPYYCPMCRDRLWSDCDDLSHHPALTQCTLLDSVLKQRHASSPYTGMVGSWASESGGMLKMESADIQSTSDEEPRLEASGETVHGAFTLSAVADSDISFTGSIAFETYNNTQSGESEDTIMNRQWNCEACTFTNEPGTIRCAICNTVRREAVWTCAACTSTNPINSRSCSLCGSPRLDQRRPRGSVQEEQSYCVQCGSSERHQSFSDLILRRFCSTCEDMTKWLPGCKYRGSVTGRLVGNGDVMEITYGIGGRLFRARFTSEGYTCDQMEALVKAAGGFFCSPCAPPLFSSVISSTNSSSTVGEEDKGGESSSMRLKIFGGAQSLQQQLVTAITYFANDLAMQYGPVVSSTFTSPPLLRRLQIFHSSWLESLSHLSSEGASTITSVCFHALSAPHPSSSTVRNASSMLRFLLARHIHLQSLQSDLIFELARLANTDAREVALQCVTQLLEELQLAPVNARCLMSIYTGDPHSLLAYQAIVFASMMGCPLKGVRESYTLATSCFMQVLRSIEMGAPVLKILERNVSPCFPHPVQLDETTVDAAGSLLKGQLRGSVGVIPSAGGKYYYEAVLPPMGARGGTAVVGWGTLQHEHEGSHNHVGSDLNSWGYNFVDRVFLMETEQLLAVSRPPGGRDVVGLLLNFDDMMMTWSVNGEEMNWVTLPSQGDGEMVYPYLSACVPQSITMRLCRTQYLPRGYKDFTPDSDLRNWEETSSLEPQSYEVYRELSQFIEEACVSDFHVSSSTRSLLNSRRVHRLLPRYSLVMNLVRQLNGDAGGGMLFRPNSVPIVLSSSPDGSEIFGQSMPLMCHLDDAEVDCQTWDMSVLSPYIDHLSALSDLTVIVARNYNFIRHSALFSRYYLLGRDLLLSQGRWSLFEITSGTLPSYGNPQVVDIDLTASRSVLEAEGFATPTQWSECRSVTSQLFRQIEQSNSIYKRAVMFSVKLLNDVTTDAGGVTRSVMSAISEELNFRVRNHTRINPALPFFTLCKHSTIFTVVPNIHYFHVGSAEEDYYHRMLTWLGKLMGNITLCGTMKLPLHFPRLVWKYLTFTESTIEDYYYDVDDTIRTVLEDPSLLQGSQLLQMLQEENISTELDHHLQDQLAEKPDVLMSRANSNADLCSPAFFQGSAFASNSSLPSFEDVSAEAQTETGQAIQQVKAQVCDALLHQYDPALFFIRTGMVSVLSKSSLETIRWDDLRRRICGIESIRASDVLASIDCSSIPSQLVLYLQEVLETMTDDQRSKFLLFCSGQSCLPLPEKIHVSCGDDPRRMPTAHTCLPISLQLQPYDSADRLREMLMKCLPHHSHFGFV